MPGAGSGYFAAEPPSDARAGRDHGSAWRAGGDSKRQWAGGQLATLPGLVHRETYRCGAHSAWQPDAECTHRKFQRQASRRVSERELVLEPVRRTGENRGLAGGLQLAAATLGALVLNARRIRAESRFAFSNFEYHTSGSASRLPGRLRRRRGAASGLDPDPAA